MLRHDGVFEGVAVRTRGGTFRTRAGRWQLRFWSSGAAIGGPVLQAEFDSQPLRFRRSGVRIESHDGRYQASVTLLGRPDSVERRIARARSEAIGSNEARRRVREGEWWMDKRVFAELGPAEAVSLVGTQYVDGWDGPVRADARRRTGILDLDPEGISLRRFRRQLHIPWSHVRSIDVEDDGGRGSSAKMTLHVGVPSGDVRFQSQLESAADVRRRLGPLTRRLHHAAAGTTGIAGP